MQREFMDFMGQIARPMMNHINRELGGAAFGQWMIDTFDSDTFEYIRDQGKEKFIEGILSYEPLAKELGRGD